MTTPMRVDAREQQRRAQHIINLEQEVGRLRNGLADLEAIVRDLATLGHPVDESDVCLLCGEIAPSHVGDLSRALTSNERAEHHHPTCPWRRAVAAHPVPGDQQ